VLIYVSNKTKAKGFTMLNKQEKPDPLQDETESILMSFKEHFRFF